MDNKKYIGTFSTEAEVLSRIDELKAQGYKEDDLYVVTNNADKVSMLRGRTDVELQGVHENQGWLDKFMNFLGGEEPVNKAFTDMGFTDEEAARYYDDARNGGILLFADRDYGKSFMDNTAVGTDRVAGDVDHYDSAAVNQDGMTVDAPPLGEGRGESVGTGQYKESDAATFRDNNYMTGTDRNDNLNSDLLHNHDNLSDEQRLRLHEEKLNVDKERVQSGEVDIDKHVVTDEQTVEVPVSREEVTIERRPVNDEMADGEVFDDGESIHIPVTEERVEVTKRPVVSEEIVVKKEEVQDTETVSETVRREEVDISGTDDEAGYDSRLGRAGGEADHLHDAAADFDDTEDLELRNRDLNNRDLDNRDRL
ncbi:YsnF/AvaK domain-containing protein [Edaphobacillus lindanitolerans]|uniref:Conserved domain-containing protein n=1 Tax=Edaphobacillus lindanitolerans TaxID=550447 RepID=A0A1U7PIX2_9BACI|nr:YsnF/AvaK domain-containing protein [Edaphobacillus lindanitolerans]SIT76137.1 conserved domain-containing protein [Edaphobacillus lindanitolerans]